MMLAVRASQGSQTPRKGAMSAKRNSEIPIRSQGSRSSENHRLRAIFVFMGADHTRSRLMDFIKKVDEESQTTLSALKAPSI